MDDYSRLLLYFLRRLPPEKLSMTADLAALLLAYSGQQSLETPEETHAESAEGGSPSQQSAP